MMNLGILATSIGVSEIAVLIWSKGKWVLLGAVLTYIWNLICDIRQTAKRRKRRKMKSERR